MDFSCAIESVSMFHFFFLWLAWLHDSCAAEAFDGGGAGYSPAGVGGISVLPISPSALGRVRRRPDKRRALGALSTGSAAAIGRCSGPLRAAVLVGIRNPSGCRIAFWRARMR